MACCERVYKCPKSGEDECLDHGGFDICCRHPECPGNPLKAMTDEEVIDSLDSIWNTFDGEYYKAIAVRAWVKYLARVGADVIKIVEGND